MSEVENFYAELSTYFPLLISAEGNKRILPGYFNSDNDDDPPILSHCLFASKVPFLIRVFFPLFLTPSNNFINFFIPLQ